VLPCLTLSLPCCSKLSGAISMSNTVATCLVFRAVTHHCWLSLTSTGILCREARTDFLSNYSVLPVSSSIVPRYPDENHLDLSSSHLLVESPRPGSMTLQGPYLRLMELSILQDETAPVGAENGKC